MRLPMPSGIPELAPEADGLASLIPCSIVPPDTRNFTAMTLPSFKRRLSEEEYLANERFAKSRSVFIDREIRLIGPAGLAAETPANLR